MQQDCLHTTHIAPACARRGHEICMNLQRHTPFDPRSQHGALVAARSPIVFVCMDLLGSLRKLGLGGREIPTSSVNPAVVFRSEACV